jgi:hypothetical protein
MNKMLNSLAIAALSIAMLAPAHAENYIKMPSGYITTKHECSADDAVCVDCTFLSNQACYEQADKAGLINKNIGFGPGQQAPARIDPITMKNIAKPLEAECGGQFQGTTRSQHIPLTNSSKSGLMGKYGQLICPVPGAVAIETSVALAELARAKAAQEEAQKIKVKDILTFQQPKFVCANINDTYEVLKSSGGSIYKAMDTANRGRLDCELERIPLILKRSLHGGKS